MPEHTSTDNIVAALTDRDGDKYSLLEKVLDLALFKEVLEKNLAASGKSKKDYRIAIKPNLSMMLRRSDVGTYTDPFIVIHLLRILLQWGYENLVVVESGNLYGNWFGNRAVVQVAGRSGYLDEKVITEYRGEKQAFIHVAGGGVDARVPIVDLTLDETVGDLGGSAGEQPLGKAWIESDFRISFAKMKTHFFAYYSLAIKNVYGCFPKQDKVRAYHCRRAVGPWTAQMIERYPVHFSIVEGYSAADGWFGVKMKGIPTHTGTIIAGADILAVDHVGATLMGLQPEKSIMYSKLSRLITMKPFKQVGNAAPFPRWRNSPGIFAKFCEIIERWSDVMDFGGSIATGGHDECFPVTFYSGRIFRRLLSYITYPANLLFDIGYMSLVWRRHELRREIAVNSDNLKTIASSSFILDRIEFIGGKEAIKISEMLRSDDGSGLRSSGHYIMNNGNEEAVRFSLSTSNIALKEIVNHARANEMDAETLAAEFSELPKISAAYFDVHNDIPFCYR